MKHSLVTKSSVKSNDAKANDDKMALRVRTGLRAGLNFTKITY